MAHRQCNHCSASVPAAARFCPRCGHERGAAAAPERRDFVGPPPAPRAPDALPSTSRMPVAGILFLVAAVLGPTLIAFGITSGNALLLVAGIAIGLGLIVLLLLGMVF